MLDRTGLTFNSVGDKRTLYSLRHTYATNQLADGKTPIHTLALTMGTSIEMLERHYSHLKVWQHAAQLAGKGSVTRRDIEELPPEQYDTIRRKMKNQFEQLIDEVLVPA